MKRDTYEIDRPLAFLISPVRNVSADEVRLISTFVAQIEAEGYDVHWPLYHTKQDDPTGARICADNLAAIRRAERVYVWWSETSEGSVFDLGMAFALGKPLLLLNRAFVKRTEGKSFQNVLLDVAQDAAK